jgi:hypothetical protein
MSLFKDFDTTDKAFESHIIFTLDICWTISSVKSIHNILNRINFNFVFSFIYSINPFSALLHVCHDGYATDYKTGLTISQNPPQFALSGLWWVLLTEQISQNRSPFYRYIKVIMTFNAIIALSTFFWQIHCQNYWYISENNK